ncbi:hypothetical protein BBJ28_00007081 [Nothophytophthora sp. Chile5]|nr:hypothetical protein BBJ28_00007081 [Nothophytophthora sp. Chile5]
MFEITVSGCAIRSQNSDSNDLNSDTSASDAAEANQFSSQKEQMDDTFDDVSTAATGAAVIPPAPRTLWEFVEFLAPVAKYYVALLVMYFAARWFNRALENEADLEEKEQVCQRPELSRELMRESSSEEEEEEDDVDEEELIEELVTDAAGKKTKKAKNASKELFDGLRKVEEELRQKKEKDEESDVSWNELHMSMLRRYKDKYPEHGPQMATPETDKYDDEFNELLRKNNINPEDLKSSNSNAKKDD